MLFVYRATRCFSTLQGKKLGFIGLGNMGLPMANNLLKLNGEVKLFDTNSQTLESFKEKGVVADSLSSLSDRDVIFLSLPNAGAVEGVLLNASGLIHKLKKGSIVVDFSTIGVPAAKNIGETLLKSGVMYADAPVSGGVVGAVNATLTFMVGSDPNLFSEIEKLLLTMGKRAIHCGGVGTGQGAKLCNNILLAMNMVATSEAYVLAKNVGLDLSKLTEIFNTSSARSWVTEINNPVPFATPKSPANDNYDKGFQANLMLKDIKLAIETGHQLKLDQTYSKIAAELYEQMIKTDPSIGKKDFSYIYQYLCGNVAQ